MTTTGKSIVWIIVLVIVVLLGWYFFMRTPASESIPAASANPSGEAGVNNSPDQTNTGEASVPPVVKVSNSAALGDFLVASNGMTLYLYTKDTANVSDCTGQCLVNWPAYTPLANEPLLAGAGITGSLSTITRADGTLQLAYKGVPLYFWKNDTKPGDTTGQNVGGVWFVVKP